MFHENGKANRIFHLVISVAALIILLSCNILNHTPKSINQTPTAVDRESNSPSVGLEEPPENPETEELPNSIFQPKVVNSLVAYTYYVIIDPSFSQNIDSFKFVIKDLCSTEVFCRIQFFTDSQMTWKAADYTRTTLPKLYQLTVFDTSKTILDVENVDLGSEYNQIDYEIEKTIARDYFFIGMSEDDVHKLDPFAGPSSAFYVFSQSLCKQNKEYCYVFIWADENLVPTDTLFTNEQTAGLKLVYFIIDSQDEFYLCTIDACDYFAFGADKYVWSNP